MNIASLIATNLNEGQDSFRILWVRRTSQNFSTCQQRSLRVLIASGRVCYLSCSEEALYLLFARITPRRWHLWSKPCTAIYHSALLASTLFKSVCSDFQNLFSERQLRKSCQTRSCEGLWRERTAFRLWYPLTRCHYLQCYSKSSWQISFWVWTWHTFCWVFSSPLVSRTLFIANLSFLRMTWTSAWTSNWSTEFRFQSPFYGLLMAPSI